MPDRHRLNTAIVKQMRGMFNIGEFLRGKRKAASEEAAEESRGV